ncbi:hypothetical protein SEEM1594_08106 [Salmonella enterica subsp. enterica serovar Muenchen str. baa1594]|nr:hypothetical protein SEEM1594_08106 [Salmonella enterica subsp. enterica serovar Muenchen str. baa1594]
MHTLLVLIKILADKEWVSDLLGILFSINFITVVFNKRKY